MLVLSRKVGERVVIDGRVTIVVTRVVGNRVTLGIDAPQDVHVLRGELQGQPQGHERGRSTVEEPAMAAEADERPRVAPLAAMMAGVLGVPAAPPVSAIP